MPAARITAEIKSSPPRRHRPQLASLRYDHRVRWLALIVLAGCGRLSFDPAVTDASTSNDGSCAWGPFSAPTVLPGPVQSTADDWFPTPTADELELYFYRFTGASGDGEVVRATRATRNDPFSAANPVTELNTTSEEGSVAISDDGLYLVLTRGLGMEPHLFEATRAIPTDTFSTPTMISSLFVNGAGDTAPWLSPDGNRLVFSSGRAGNMLEIFETTRPDRNSAWGTPVRLTELGSLAQDDNATLSADGLEVFFSSQRAGRDDIYHATRVSLDEPFTAPVLVSELSSPRDDLGTRLSRDGKTIYFAYDAVRGGGQNGQIWTATRSLACAHASRTSTPAPH